MSTGTRSCALLLAASLFAACRSGLPSVQGEHWSVDSVPQRMFKRFTGFVPERDGNFIDYQYEKKQDVNRTLRRMFAGNWSDSPFQADDPSQTSRRPAHSIAPDPLYYVGAEGIVMGTFLFGISGGFLPLPVDSLLATFVFGGEDEFVEGFLGGDASKRLPPSPSEFRVKNR